MDVRALLDQRDGVQILDVRWPNEWEAGHIEPSLHIPSDYLYDRLHEIDRARPVVAVCRFGSRSATAAEILDSEGFDADHLTGGLLAWEAQGLDLVTADGQPGRVVEPEPPADERPEHLQQLEARYLDAAFAVQEYFGDDEPSDEEVRDFLRNRLIGEGHSPAEADRILDGGAAPGG